MKTIQKTIGGKEGELRNYYKYMPYLHNKQSKFYILDFTTLDNITYTAGIALDREDINHNLVEAHLHCLDVITDKINAEFIAL